MKNKRRREIKKERKKTIWGEENRGEIIEEIETRVKTLWDSNNKAEKKKNLQKLFDYFYFFLIPQNVLKTNTAQNPSQRNVSPNQFSTYSSFSFFF